MSKANQRMPVVFIPHGGGPWPFVDMGLDRADVEKLAGYLRTLPNATPVAPKALLVVSAHWEAAVPSVMTSPQPPILYDYYGFPPAAYRIAWPAPGAPSLAARVQSLLGGAGFETATDEERGYDHGAFIPLKVAYPDAAIPTTQLSLVPTLDPATHVGIGRALAPLRDEGVFIIGSGMSFHNMRAFRDPRGRAISETFDEWLRETIELPPNERDNRLLHWSDAPAARGAHPREEHLLPLMVAAGAAGDDPGVVAFSDSFMGTRITAAHFGAGA